MKDFTFATPGKLIFGSGRLQDIGELASELGSKVLLVTGRGFVRRTGLLSRIHEYLEESSLVVALYDQSPPEPTVDAVEEAITLYRSASCDIVIAVGGGSAIDVGKTVAILAEAPGSVSEYLAGRTLPDRGVPFIAVPTTSGSGSEATPNSVLTDTKRSIKASIRSHIMMPDVALVDPELTLSLPPDITAWSGMDALSQALEALVSNGSNPLTDAVAFDASIRLMRNLLLAYSDGGNLDARSEVAVGSLMAGIALANARLGLVHGLAHPLGVETHLPHGLICALLLPHVMRFNMPVSGEKYDRVAKEVGVEDLVAEIETMNREMGIEAHKAELRVDQEKWPSMIAQSMTSGSTRSNPRPVSERDIKDLLSIL